MLPAEHAEQDLCNDRLTARLPVRLSVPSIDVSSGASGWFAAERRRLQRISIASWYGLGARSAANADSVMF